MREYRTRTVKERNGWRVTLTCCACRGRHEVFVPNLCGSAEDGKAIAKNAMDFHKCPAESKKL